MVVSCWHFQKILVNKTFGKTLQFVWGVEGRVSVGAPVKQVWVWWRFCLGHSLSHRLRRLLSFPLLPYVFSHIPLNSHICTKSQGIWIEGVTILLHICHKMLPSVLHNSWLLRDLSTRQLDPALGKFQTNLRNAETQIALDWALGTKLLSVSRCTICASSNGLNHLWQDFWVPFLQLYATCMTAIVIYLGVAQSCGCNFCTAALNQAWLNLKRHLNPSNWVWQFNCDFRTRYYEVQIVSRPTLLKDNILCEVLWLSFISCCSQFFAKLEFLHWVWCGGGSIRVFKQETSKDLFQFQAILKSLQVE